LSLSYRVYGLSKINSAVETNRARLSVPAISSELLALIAFFG